MWKMRSPPDVFDIWWWASAPYTLVFALFVVVIRPSPGFLAHVILPFLYLFELTLVSAALWSIWFVLSCLVSPRSRSARLARAWMLVVALLACVLGVILERA
jgi:hypothetical protein